MRAAPVAAVVGGTVPRAPPAGFTNGGSVVASIGFPLPLLPEPPAVGPTVGTAGFTGSTAVPAAVGAAVATSPPGAAEGVVVSSGASVAPGAPVRY